MQTISRSEEQTAAIAARLARRLTPGDIVFLSGQLGAGKTFFIRAAARELGVREPVTSPSFTLAQSYKGEVTVHHLDLYRLSAFGRDDAADLEPYFEPEAITFVEWPEPLAGSFRPDVEVHMGHVSRNSRSISITGSGDLKTVIEESFADTGH